MNDILRNLANLLMQAYCEEHGIPANGYKGEGTYTRKQGRGVSGRLFYSLVSVTTKRPIVTITLWKSQVPSYFVHEVNNNSIDFA